MENEDKETQVEDVNTETDTPPESSPEPKTAEPGSEPLEKPSDVEVTDEDVDALLADGTSEKKEVRIPYKKFQETNEKAKLFEQFSPLLSKLQENPDVIDRILKGESPDSLAAKVAKIEEERRQEKLKETKTVLREAMTLWPKFREQWAEEIRPIVESLEKQGFGYAEAINRAYFAVNPDEVEKAVRVSAQERGNTLGVVRSSSGASPVSHQKDTEDDYNFTEADKAFLAKMPDIDPKLYKKWAHLTP